MTQRAVEILPNSTARLRSLVLRLMTLWLKFYMENSLGMAPC